MTLTKALLLTTSIVFILIDFFNRKASVCSSLEKLGPIMTGAIFKFVSFLVFGVLGVICEPSQTCRTAEEKQLCYDVCEDMGEIRSEIDICKAGCERCDCRRGGQDDVYEDVGPNIILCNPTLPHFPMEEMPFVIPPNEKLRN